MEEYEQPMHPIAVIDTREDVTAVADESNQQVGQVFVEQTTFALPIKPPSCQFGSCNIFERASRVFGNSIQSLNLFATMSTAFTPETAEPFTPPTFCATTTILQPEKILGFRLVEIHCI
jgi:hypothetical protein